MFSVSVCIQDRYSCAGAIIYTKIIHCSYNNTANVHPLYCEQVNTVED